MELDGVLDLHVHAAPDVRTRKMTAYELAEAARAARMRGFLLKNHHTSTVALAATLRQAVDGLEIFGGLVLNDSVGGLNPAAVEAALRMGAAEIWMPTLSSCQEQTFRGASGAGIVVFEENGKPHACLGQILKLIAEWNAILGTGHLSPREISCLVRMGRDAGARKFLITHPELRFVNLSLDLQRELAGPGIYFERCYARDGFVLDWDGLARVIRAVGVETTVLATDLGQPENPDPISGMREILDQLRRRGFTHQELEIMACRNPATLLGL